VAFVRAVTDDEACGEIAGLFAADRERLGYVANYTRTFGAHRPEPFVAWRRLIGSISESMDERHYELATLAAARQLRSSYCALAHGTILAERLLEPAAVRELAAGGLPGALDPLERAIVDLAAKVAEDATSVGEDDVQRLRYHGLDDGQIVDVVLAAAARSFFSKTLDALGILPDHAYQAVEPELRDALVVGRPIAGT
jgi:uncharacterized peroxidase-related enzyme